MGVVIEAVATTRPTRNPLSHGARRLANQAVRDCLRKAGRDPGDVDMLVNAGVYRERGLGEPALAALIQQDVRVNPAATRGRQGTFSFDIDNGACGFLTGVDVLRGFLSSGAIGSGVVVASDSGPGPLHAGWYRYGESGGAALVRLDPEVAGFTNLGFATYPEFDRLLEGYWEWRDSHLPRRARAMGFNRLVVVERPGFRERAAACAVEATGKFLAGAGLGIADIDLLVATPNDGFSDLVADGLGIRHERTLHVGERIGLMHSAQPMAAIDIAQRTGRWAEARTVLFVCAAAGITVANAVYRH